MLSKGKTLFYEHWKNSGINFVDNLLTNDGKFKPLSLFLYGVGNTSTRASI